MALKISVELLRRPKYWAPIARTACRDKGVAYDRFEPTQRSCKRCCRLDGKRCPASIRPRTAAGAVPGMPAGAKLGFYEKGNIQLRYAEIGSGFPLLATPGGGLNSCIAAWARAVINIPEEFKNDFRVITMDQRNATGGESTGPVPVDDPWGAFADDQLGVMGHLGMNEFFFFGNCIDALRRPLHQLHRERAAARGDIEPASRAHPGEPGLHVRRRQGLGQGAARAPTRRLDGDHREISAQPLSRATRFRVQRIARFRKIMPDVDAVPDDIVAHPLVTSIDVASLCPNAEITVFPWKEPPELKARTINRARTFLKRYQTA